jgi:competence protein ComEA
MPAFDGLAPRKGALLRPAPRRVSRLAGAAQNADQPATKSLAVIANPASRRSDMFRTLTALVLAAFAFAAQAAVEVNQASQAELETVKGIGPGLSGKILEARKSGAFKDWTDLVDRVGGMGPGNAAKFSQAGLTVSGAPYAVAAAAPAAAGKASGEKKPAKSEPAKAPR